MAETGIGSQDPATTFPAPQPGNVSRLPSGHNTSIASTRMAGPSPKWTRGSLLHR